MTYEETISYLYEWLPMYQHIGASAYKSDLDNTIRIMDLLDHPERKFKSIHIAGTNGKGSVSNMLASVLMEAGYKTGLYTSPHLLDFRERMRINGKEISKETVVEFVEKNKNSFEGIEPSFFEWTVGLAFDYFAREKVDIAIIETGLGGRLDSTNVITPVLSVITNVSYDHMNLLGDTLEKIAVEKAGIIKPGVPVILGEHNNETDPVFNEKASGNNSEIIYAPDIFTTTSDKYNIDQTMLVNIYKNSESYLNNLSTDLTGDYQLTNLCTSIAALEKLIELEFKLDKKVIRTGLNKVRQNMGFSGRWQIINTFPLVVCDTAHNTAGIKHVVEQLERTPHKKLHIVLGMTKDKEVDSMLRLFPQKASYYFCRASVPRALHENVLKKDAEKLGLSGEAFQNVQSAIENAYEKAEKNDLLFIGGSTFTVSDALLFFVQSGIVRGK